MVSWSRRFRMFWHHATEDRRRSSQEDRDQFERRKRALENERRDIENRIRYLEASASLLEDQELSGFKR